MGVLRRVLLSAVFGEVMFEPDLDKLKRMYDNGFNFRQVTHELLHDDEISALRRERSKEARQANRRRGIPVPCKPETSDKEELKAWKRAYMKAWRLKMKLEEPEKFYKVTVEKRDWMRRSRA